MNSKHLIYICIEFELGTPIGEVSRIYGSRGGSLMWRIKTEKGSYAVKQLAPVIDLTSERIVTKYELSETIASRFENQGISAVCALEKSGKHLIVIENIGYLVYPWVDGYTLGRNAVSETHALKIAVIIARLHSINLNIPEIGEPRFDIHTNDSIVNAINRAVSFKCPFVKTMKDAQSLILSVNERYQMAIPLLKEQTVVTHGDLNQLNVLWDKAEKAIVIDWESVRKLNTTREIMGASLDWSGFGTAEFSMPLYTNMMHQYIKSGGKLKKSHMMAATDGMFGSMINWLLYNIELACISDVSEAKDMAIKEVHQVLTSITGLKKLISTLLKVSVE